MRQELQPNGFRVDAPDNILISGQVEPLVHFDGTNWSPVPGSFDILYDIWGSSWNDIFVVGMNGATHHFDGSGWTKMDKPQNEWEPNLFGVWGSDGADVYAVGLFGTVRHYDGTSWQSVPNPGENTLKRVWGSPEGIVYAVGEDSTIISTNPEPAPDSHCNPSPEAGFSAATASGPAPLVVDFVDDTTGIARSWHWDFGDGSDSTDHNPTHTFDIPGTYTVTLTVAGRDGSDSETKFGFITVSDSRIENGDDGDGGGGCFINTAFPTHIIPLKWVVYPFNFLERHKVSLMYSRRSIRTETAKQAQP